MVELGYLFRSNYSCQQLDCLMGYRAGRLDKISLVMLFKATTTTIKTI